MGNRPIIFVNTDKWRNVTDSDTKHKESEVIRNGR